MENKRPTGRKRNVTGTGKPVYRRGEGLGNGPVGNGRPDNFSGPVHKVEVTGKTGSGRGVKRGGALSLVAIAALLLFGLAAAHACGIAMLCFTLKRSLVQACAIDAVFLPGDLAKACMALAIWRMLQKKNAHA